MSTGFRGCRWWGFILLLVGGGCLVAITGVAAASNLDDIGITALRNADPTLTGSGIAVIQAEANYQSVTGEYQVNPGAVNGGGQNPTLLPSQFTYISSTGVILTSGTYTTPNAAGLESGHADVVGNNFYGNAASGPYPYSDPGAAPGVSTIDNYQADYYYDNLIAPNVLPSSISSRLHNARVVNQSFTFGAQYTEVDEQYDNYADLYNVLFVSAIGNGSSGQSRLAVELLQRDCGGVHRSVGHANGGSHR